MKINIKELIVTVTAIALGTVSVMYAAPTTTAPDGNISRPIHGVPFGLTQSKVGTLVSGDSVNRVLSVGTSTLPGSNVTLGVTGSVQVGTLSSDYDSFVVTGYATDTSSTGLNIKPTSTSTPIDGTMSLWNSVTYGTSANKPLCIQQVTTSGVTVNQVVQC